MAFGPVAFGAAVIGMAAFGAAASQICGSSVWLCRLMVSGWVVAGSMFLLQLVVWHQVFHGGFGGSMF